MGLDPYSMALLVHLSQPAVLAAMARVGWEVGAGVDGAEVGAPVVLKGT